MKAIFWAGCLVAAVAHGEQAFVADGNMTLEQALEKSRTVTGEKKIIVRGTHVLAKPLTLTEKDNGLTFVSEDGVLSGGVRLADWKRDEKGLAYVEVPKGVRPRVAFREDGAFLEQAVYPKEGHLQNLNKPQKLWWTGSRGGGWNRPLTEEEVTIALLKPADIPSGMDMENAEITLFHSWDESTVPVKSYDRATGRVAFASPTEHPAGAFKNNDYLVRNVREGMVPGRWYFDRKQSRVYYEPEKGEKQMAVIVSPLDNILLAEGVKNLRVEGLAFRYTNPSFQRSGLRSINMPGAVECRDCENVVLENCSFRQLGGHGVKFLRCKNLRVCDSFFCETGAGGIFTHECEDELIARNVVKDIGRTFYASCSIHAGGKSLLVYIQDGRKQEKGCTKILNNVIDGSPYCGITCNGEGHAVQGNRISRCMTKLNDGAAIYCSRAIGMNVCDNVVTGVHSHNDGLAIAYDFDEFSENSVLRGNTAYDCFKPFLAHLARRIRVENNVFTCKDSLTVMLHGSENFLFKDNVFLTDGELEFSFRPDGIKTADGRLKVFPFGSVFTNTLLYSRSGCYRSPKEPLPKINGVRTIEPLD